MHPVGTPSYRPAQAFHGDETFSLQYLRARAFNPVSPELEVATHVLAHV
jgi:hypothetical protein